VAAQPTPVASHRIDGVDSTGVGGPGCRDDSHRHHAVRDIPVDHVGQAADVHPLTIVHGDPPDAFPAQPQHGCRALDGVCASWLARWGLATAAASCATAAEVVGPVVMNPLKPVS
jgi:hypothetical protein